MKKIVVSFMCLMLICSICMGLEPPLPENYIHNSDCGYGFMPNGKAYYYYAGSNDYGECLGLNHPLSNWKDNDAKLENPEFFEMIHENIMRYRTMVYGHELITDFRYLYDQPADFLEFPKENKCAPFLISLEGYKNATINTKDKTVTLYYEKGKSLNKVNLKFELTPWGIFDYIIKPDCATGKCTHEHFLISNNKQLIEEFNKVQNTTGFNYNAWDEWNKIVQKVKKETIDYNKSTFLYIFSYGVKDFIDKYKVQIQYVNDLYPKESPKIVPQHTQYDKRFTNARNIIYNLFDTVSISKVSVNGKEIQLNTDYFCNNEYLVISKNYLSKLETGKNAKIDVDFQDGTTYSLDVDVEDTTLKDYKAIFTDVSSKNENWEFIQTLYEKNIINGSGHGFEPDREITTAEFYVMLARAMDVVITKGGNWYDWAVNGISGENSVIEPNKPIGSYDAEKLLIDSVIKNLKYNTLMEDGVYGRKDNDTDFGFKSLPFIESALEKGLLTRGDAAKAIVRFINLKELTEGKPV